MLALAAIRMGLNVRFLLPRPEGSVDGLGEAMVGDWTDPEVLHRFASACSVLTVESEWAPAEEAAGVLLSGVAIWPSPYTIGLIQDKGRQKSVLKEAGLPVPSFTLPASLEEALRDADILGYPLLLKKRLGSYDGYGNADVKDASGLRTAWNRLHEGGVMLEAWAPFVRELSVIIARRPGGEHVVYPVALTVQKDHRCHSVVAPAPIEPAVAERARQTALRAVEAVDGVGVTAVEMFEMPDGNVLVNELAPRPHNTGHYSIEGCYTSQFENHLRAILDWPLGSPALRAPVAVMVNVLGEREGEPDPTTVPDALSMPGVSIHLYGKTEVRPKRKMGHVTITGADASDALSRAEMSARRIRL